MLKYLIDGDESNPDDCSMPKSGYIFDVNQSIEILEWVLEGF